MLNSSIELSIYNHLSYEFNFKTDDIEIELNVSININGSKIKEIVPGNLLFGIQYNKMNNLIFYRKIGMILYRGVTIVEAILFAYRNS